MSIMVGDSETIRRFIFPQCEAGKHELCPSWQSGYVDGQLRSAGEQCSCVCHRPDSELETLTGAGVLDLEREIKG
jgi:hypothetical protein